MKKTPPPLPPLPLPGRIHSKQPGYEIVLSERRHRAVELRKQGKSFRRIGQTLGVSDKTAAADIRHCLENLIRDTAESTEQLRELANARLDMIIETLWDKVAKGDLWATDRFLACLDQISRLNGLNKPVRHILAGDKDAPIFIEEKKARDEQLLALFQKLASKQSVGVIDITPENPQLPQ